MDASTSSLVGDSAEDRLEALSKQFFMALSKKAKRTSAKDLLTLQPERASAYLVDDIEDDPALVEELNEELNEGDGAAAEEEEAGAQAREQQTQQALFASKKLLFASSKKLLREDRTSMREPTNDRRSHKDLMDERVSKTGPGRTRTRTRTRMLDTMPGNKPPAPNPEDTEISIIDGWGEASSQRSCPALV
jgi:hypothetical protein